MLTAMEGAQVNVPLTAAKYFVKVSLALHWMLTFVSRLPNHGHTPS